MIVHNMLNPIVFLKVEFSLLPSSLLLSLKSRHRCGGVMGDHRNMIPVSDQSCEGQAGAGPSDGGHGAWSCASFCSVSDFVCVVSVYLFEWLTHLNSNNSITK